MYGGDYSAAFDATTDALTAGQGQRARTMASAILAQATAEDDLLTQAQAFYLLGRIEHAEADLSSALPLARQAAHLFHVLNESLKESRARAHVAQLAILMGLSEEALESATLSVQLVDALPPGAHTLEAYNYLGVASIWFDADHADHILQRAVDLALQHFSPLAATRPMGNRLINELHRLEICLQCGQPATVKPVIWKQLASLEQLVENLKPGDLLPSGLSQPQMRILLHLNRAGLNAHAGQDHSAVDTALQADLHGMPSWLHGMALLCRTRCLLSLGRWHEALETTLQTLDLAQRQNQSNVVLMSLYQRMEACEALGRTGQMLAEFKRFRHHQVRQQTNLIASRKRMASLRLAWRQQTQALEALQTSSRALERLTLEDDLTGLSNRRHLERKLAELLKPEPGRPHVPWCLVMIDIDDFKQINDQYSHLLGDDVLRQMAMLLRQVVRPKDMAVRLAGDEFVLILSDTTESAGLQIVERLSRAIDGHPWCELQPGLVVRTSIGLTQVRPDDTSTSLLQRSDLRMYADKADKLMRHLDSATRNPSAAG